MPDDVFKLADKVMDGPKKGRASTDGGLGHAELRDRWIEKYPDVAFDGMDWLVYADGWWSAVNELEVKAQIVEVLEGSALEGVKVTRSLLQSILELAKIAVYVPRVRWDANPNILVCENGTLEVWTRELRDHSPHDYAKSALPYSYDPEARADVFLAMLGKTLPEEMDYLQEFAGYCLTQDTSYEHAVWLKGPRGSGKSTLLEGFTAMLGEKHGVLGLGEMESSNFALADIPGKTLLTSTEQPAGFVKSTHVIDALISGEKMRIDRKNRDIETVTPVAKVMWAMNEAPRIAGTQAGIFRRVNIVEFPELVGKPVPAIKEQVKLEGAGILNWALEGLLRLGERGEFAVPESVKRATADWEKSNDPYLSFVEEQVIRQPDGTMPRSLLYSRYKVWCEEFGHKPAAVNKAAQEWKRLGFHDGWEGKTKIYRGGVLK